MNGLRKLDLRVILTDAASVVVSFIIANLGYLVFYQDNLVFFRESFTKTLALFLVAFIISEFVTIGKNRNFMKRTSVEEMYNVIKLTAIMAIVCTFIIFLSRSAFDVSRGVFIFTLITNIVVNTIFRNILTAVYKSDSKKKWKSKLLIITTYEDAQSNFISEKIADGLLSEIIGLAIVDKDCIGEHVNGYDVVASFDNVVQYSKNEILDGSLVVLHNGWWEKVADIIEDLQAMGVIVHLGIDTLSIYDGYEQSINYVGNYPVLSFAKSNHTEESLIAKRIIDIIGGLVGSIGALLVMAILGPIIKLESPGPIIFKQRRVGKNGRYFNIYKFRSMGVDAEARKQSLMDQNEVDGHMFKMTNDPRVTKVGKFIRATSLDELPQFFNVLKGDMSLVGTRPPTVEEFKEYKVHHKRRLSMKPGITGMWQVSGRSDITDFEEVVRLDTEYIDKYSLALDMKIIAKTFIVVFAKIGSR